MSTRSPIRFGYDEAWFGEHHNGGSELVGTPEIMIAMAAERTRHIMLGTGVTSLRYHHPFLVAERMTMLDHLTRGRVILGCGPGSLAFDAHIMGLDYAKSRQRTSESVEAIMALLRSPDPVSIKTDWFELRDAQLQMRPFSYPHFEVTTAGTSSPSGPRLAGRNGISLLTISASSPEASKRSVTPGRSSKTKPPRMVSRSTGQAGAWSASSTSPTPRIRPARTSAMGSST